MIRARFCWCTQDLVDNHAIGQLLSAALSRGMQLLLQEVQRQGKVQDAAVDALLDLEGALFDFTCSWGTYTAGIVCSTQQPAAGNVVGQQIAASGAQPVADFL